MAVLQNLQTGEKVRVLACSMIGRSARSDIRLKGEAASNSHATISWDGVRWNLKDLSLNGTCVNGIVLNSGQRWRISMGDTITFGDPSERWLWLDGEPPHAAAVCRERQLRVEATDGVILLPNEDEPRVSVYLRDDHWELDADGAVRRVDDGELVLVEELTFQLDLPCIDPESINTRNYQHERRLAGARIHLRPSRDEEFVAVRIDSGASSFELRPRASHYMLLLLARGRSKDLTSGLPDSEAGWIHADDLARQRRITVEELNVDICRVRKQVAETCKFADSVSIIERRHGTGQLRLGVADINIEA